MLLNLRLSQQTMLLVLGPLLANIVFIYCLYSSLSDMEVQAEQAEQARTIALHMNNFMRAALAMAGHVKFSLVNKDLGDTADYIGEIKTELGILKELTKNRPEERAIVERISKKIEKGIEYAYQIRDYVQNDNLETAGRLRRELKPILAEAAAHLEDLRIEEERLERFAPHVVAQRRELIKSFVIVGISVNVLLAFFLTLIVNRSLLQRLGIVAYNARAFTDNRPLLPPPGGSDEIAALDQSFRDMAQALTLARSYERSEADRLIQIVHGLPLGLALLNAKGEITMTNETLSKMLLLNEDELVGQTLGSFFTPAVDFDTLLSKKQLEARKFNGATFPAEIACTCIETHEGVSWLFLLVDISERLNVERMKQQFVAVVSHELRTPLTTVGNFCEMIEEGIYGRLNDSGMESLKGVQTGVTRLIKLTRDLLDIERLEAGYMQLDIREFDFNQVLAQALHAVSGQADKLGVNVEMPSTEVSVSADLERSVQVLVNLISNALKFSVPGSTVKVSLKKEPNTHKSEWEHATGAITLSKEHEMLKIEVIDSGPGIAVEHQRRIFDRFQQVSTDDAKKRGGAGLGLAICKSIVEGHGGTIGVDSEPGQGSIFWFTLPVAHETKSFQSKIDGGGS